MNNADMDKVTHNVHVYDAHVKEYITRFMDLSMYKDSFNYLTEHLPQKAEVMEMGCGPGNVIKYLSGKRKDISFIGIDASPAMITAAQQENPKQRFYILDIRSAEIIANRLEGIIAAFSIPYLLREDLDKFFTNCHKLLNPGGLLYISCMEGPEERSGFEKTSFTAEEELFISYYDRKYLEKKLQEYGFEIKEFLTQDYRESDGSITKDLIFTAEKAT